MTVRDSLLECEASRRMERQDGYCVSAGQGPTLASTLPKSESHHIPQEEPSNIIPVTHDPQHPTYINIQLSLISTGHREQGRLPIGVCLSPTVRIEPIASPSHAQGAPLAILPANAPLAAPLEDHNGITREDQR